MRQEMILRTLKAKIATGIVFLSVLASASVQACVGCREPGTLTLEHEAPTVLAGMAFSWSVLFMLGFVMAIVLGMSLYIWRTCRQLDQRNDRR